MRVWLSTPFEQLREKTPRDADALLLRQKVLQNQLETKQKDRYIYIKTVSINNHVFLGLC